MWHIEGANADGFRLDVVRTGPVVWDFTPIPGAPADPVLMESWIRANQFGRGAQIFDGAQAGFAWMPSFTPKNPTRAGVHASGDDIYNAGEDFADWNVEHILNGVSATFEFYKTTSVYTPPGSVAVPEPGRLGIVLLACGAIGLAYARRRPGCGIAAGFGGEGRRPR